MGSLVRAQEREQTEKSSSMMTFFVYNTSLFLLFIDFLGSSPIEGFVFFRHNSSGVLPMIFCLCQECAKCQFFLIDLTNKYLTMKNLITLLVIISITTTCISCESPKKFDLGNAKKEIEEANRNFEKYVKTGDSVAFAKNCYTIDAHYMAPNLPAIVGRNAIQTMSHQTISAGVSEIKLHTIEMWGDENGITEEGTLEVYVKGGKLVDKGKYLVLWKKEDGMWKLHRDLFNSDMPMATK